VSREWKPGDVALVRRGPSWSGRAMWTLEGWIDQGGDRERVPLFDITDARPLVVIDPEDREQVNRLDVALSAMSFSARHCGSFSVLQAALREFANPTPPKPAEPTGLGAVVEDAAGTHWVRHQTTGGGGWYVDGITRSYDDIAAVKVLSEGVTS